jgi:hypothetical protein
MFMRMYAHGWHCHVVSMHGGTDMAAPESPLECVLATDAHLDLFDPQCSESASDLV